MCAHSVFIGRFTYTEFWWYIILLHRAVIGTAMIMIRVLMIAEVLGILHKLHKPSILCICTFCFVWHCLIYCFWLQALELMLFLSNCVLVCCAWVAVCLWLCACVPVCLCACFLCACVLVCLCDVCLCACVPVCLFPVFLCSCVPVCLCASFREYERSSSYPPSSHGFTIPALQWIHWYS
jgi:hypothetical protein